LYYSFKTGGRKWTAQINTNNLADETFVSGNNFGPGREIRFTLRTTF
jgi:hypothetical protein